MATQITPNIVAVSSYSKTTGAPELYSISRSTGKRPRSIESCDGTNEVL